MNNREKGSSYEETAAAFLERQGYRLLEKNYSRKTGEIDLILKDPDEITIVFAEVKYRKRMRNGYPEEAVTAAKQMHIYRTAQWYLAEHRIPETNPCRFDVISILGTEITHIRNAFGGF